MQDAQKPAFSDIKGKVIAIYACCEHEFTVATEHSPGANPFEPLESLRHIKEAKSKADYLIVLFHGGIEFNYRKFAEEHLNSYLLRLGGKMTNNLFYRALNKLTGRKLIRKTFSDAELLCLIDYIRCEAHNELIDTACMDRVMR